MALLDVLETFLRPRVTPGDLLLTAFSGGPDSTALLAALVRLQPRLAVRLHAAHLDHQLDGGSARRAATAGELALRLGVPYSAASTSVPLRRARGESLEEAARRERYDFLERTAASLGARWILTAHHRDDQAETVLLRLRQGSGLEGVAAIRPQRGRLLRPLLEVPRAVLSASLHGSSLPAVDDPGNRDLARARNLVRHRLLPRLIESEPPNQLGAQPELVTLLGRVAGAMQRAQPAIDRHLALALGPVRGEQQVTVERRRLQALPAGLRPAAIGYLRRLGGAPRPLSGASQEELWRQIGEAGAIGCDAGRGWRWSGRGELVTLAPVPAAGTPFTYTFAVPGHCDVAEIGCRVHLRPAAIEDWMLRGEPRRAGLALDLAPGNQVTVRNRQAGDRVHPLGASGRRRLKDILVDRGLPRAERQRLPLLCIGGRIAWVPGVTIDEAFRLKPGRPVWLAEIEDL
jgi:tRNA(Ile)-lysidine synthase